MKNRTSWVLLALATFLVSASGWATECRFFRIECQDGEAPENLAITMDESGQTFLEFDTVQGHSYSIEATDSLSPPVWGGVWTLTGDGQRAAWLTTSRRWSRTFGGTGLDGPRSVQQTTDGGYILAGFTYSFGAGGQDVYLIKTDANGEAVKRGWTNTFGGTGDDWASSVQQTSDGGYIVAGSTGSFGVRAQDLYLIKTDAAGNEVWSKTFGGSMGDVGRSVQQTSDGGYIVAGGTGSFGAGMGDVYLIKTDQNGNEVWSRTFGGSMGDFGRSVQQTSDGGYIVAGGTYSFGEGNYDVYLIKTDADGNEVWSRTFGGSREDSGRSVQQTPDGGYIVAGYTDSFGAGARDVYLIKTDAQGGEVWSRTLGGSYFDMTNIVQLTSDGGYILAGGTASFGAAEGDGYLIKTDANGNEVWSRTFGGSAYDGASSVQQTSDGGYILAGETRSLGAGSNDVYLIKTDPKGREVWSKTFGGTGYEFGYSVQQTSDGGYIVAGETHSFGAGDYDVYLIKTDPNGNAPPPE